MGETKKPRVDDLRLSGIIAATLDVLKANGGWFHSPAVPHQDHIDLALDLHDARAEVERLRGIALAAVAEIRKLSPRDVDQCDDATGLYPTLRSVPSVVGP